MPLPESRGFAPPVPGLTQTAGIAPGAMNPMQLVSMMLGNRPSQEPTAGDKMARVVQLLREISKEDPRLGLLTSEALRVLIEGGQSQLIPPQAMAAQAGPMAAMAGGAGLRGGPGG